MITITVNRKIAKKKQQQQSMIKKKTMLRINRKTKRNPLMINNNQSLNLCVSLT